MEKEILRKIIEDKFEDFDYQRDTPQSFFVDEVMVAIDNYVFDVIHKAKKEAVLNYLEQQLKNVIKN